MPASRKSAKPRARARTPARSRAAGAASLLEKRCVPCEGGVPRLPAKEVARLARQVRGWKVVGGRKLSRRLDFDDFVTLMEFVTDLATLAEDEGHHPDFCVHYSRLEIEISTHAIGGLSENDFVLAAKIDQLLGKGT